MNNGFVFACNSYFYSGLIVTIKSLLRFNPSAKIEVLDTGLSNDQIKDLDSKKIRVIDIKNKFEMHFQNKREWHSDFSVYGSLFIDESSFDNIIFCDSDLLILDDLSEYFSFIQKYKIVATKGDSTKSYFHPNGMVRLKEYVTPKGQEVLNELYDINWDYVTFNSGFWGIQKSYYKKLKQKYWYLLEQYESEFTFHDQTFINLTVCLDNRCYYDAGFAYNAVNISKQNSFYNFNSFLKYIFYMLTRQFYHVNGLHVSYKGIPVKVLHWTGIGKPFLEDSVKAIGNASRPWREISDCNHKRINCERAIEVEQCYLTL